MWNPFKKTDKDLLIIDQKRRIDALAKKIEHDRCAYADEMRLHKEASESVIKALNVDNRRGVPYDITHAQPGIRGAISRFKAWRYPGRSYLINMELRNGTHKSFLVSAYWDYFVFGDAKYIIDPSCIYREISSGMSCLDYHQDISLPIKRNIIAKDIKDAVSEAGTCEFKMALNPQLLSDAQDADFASKLLKKSAEFLKNLKIIIVIVAISGILTLMTMIITLKTSGMLDNIHIPGMR